MLAAVCYGAEDIRIEEIENVTIGPEEVLIKVAYCGICPSDLKVYQGLSSMKLPVVLGHEFVGWVESIGEKVTGLKVGSRVVVDPAKKCYTRCSACKHGFYNKCVHMSEAYYGFAQYHVTRSANVYTLKKETDFIAACFTEPLACVLRGQSIGKIKAGDIVLIIGAGPIGLLHLLVAKFFGARVVVSDLSAKRLEYAAELGADLVIKPGPNNLKEAILSISDGWGADAVIVAAGSTAAIEESVDLLCVGGTLVIFAGIRGDSKISLDAKRIHYDEINITGSSDYDDLEFINALRLIEKKDIDTKKLISDIVDFKDIKKGMELVGSENRLKVLVKIAE